MTITMHAEVDPPPSAARGSLEHAVRRLAVVEGTRLLRHPAYLAGCALTVAYFLNTHGDPNAAYLGLVGVGGMGPGIGLLVAANMATLRARADDAEELLEAAVLDVSDRSRALALGTLLPTAAATALTLLLGAVAWVWVGMPVAYPWGHADSWPSPLELAQVPAFLAACGAFGVALGRWVPYRLASVVTGLAFFFVLIPTFFWTSEGPLARLGPLIDHSDVHHWVQVTPTSGHNAVNGFHVARLGWHVVYLVGMTTVLVGVALARGRHERGVGRLLAVGAALASVGGLAQMA